MAMSAPPKKPVQQPLFAKSFGEHHGRPVAEAPTGVGTLPLDVYVAWRALQMNGPQTAGQLEKWLLRERDWSHARVERTVKAVATCGYVEMDENGAMTAREETR
jgi:hypothetical protein